MMTPRGCGAIADRLKHVELDAQMRHVAGLIGADPTIQSARDWSAHLDFVPDQLGTNRCVGWSFSSALYLAAQLHGSPILRPSAKWLYDIGRYHDSPDVLVDVGSRPRSVCLAASRHGIVSEQSLPSTVANVDTPPPFDADIIGADALFTGYYKVEGEVPTLLRMALNKGHFPTFAMAVHESFLDLGRVAVYDEPRGAMYGRHMVTLVGYREGAFLVLNSWGRTWGAEGFCWLTDRFISSSYVSDRYVVTAAPRIT